MLNEDVLQVYQRPLICNDFDNGVRWTDNERLDEMFERCCDRVGLDRLAIITEDVALTFRELDSRANQTARYLLEQGLTAGDRIGLLFDKSIHGYVALLAVLKIGAAYVPLDASFPAERMSFILEDAGVEAILSVSRFRSKLAEFAIDEIFLDTSQARIEQQATSRLDVRERAPSSSDRLFYIIYTSGTTGKPKGVAIGHSGICNFVKVAEEVYGIREGDRCYQGMTLAFDFHVEDLWVPLVTGATLVAGKSGANLFGDELYEFLREQRITVFPCVPTLLATIEHDLPDVRIVLLSGEAVPHNLVVRWHRAGRSILNAYGPTECSVSSTIRKLVPDSPVTIGRPLPTYTVVILDENKDDVVADGAIGEIGIAGIGLAMGYLNREDLTKEKFIPDFLNLANNPSKRIYRTGDLGRIRDDSELEFHGRIDTQVKIRGYRVELGEIESLLMQQLHIAQAVVQPYEAAPGVPDLVAYYTRRTGVAETPPVEVLESLRRHLPGYMVPAYLEELPFIPMTANKKADRQNLPAPKGLRLAASSGSFVAPRSVTEQALAGALGEVMKIERASVRDNFFRDLGGHSLLMARFSAEIRRRLNISAVSMQDIYLNPTIEQLARHIDSLPRETASQAQQATNRESFHFPSDLAYFTCGALQFAWFLGWGWVGIWLFVTGIIWTYAAMPDIGATYVRIVTFAAALTVLFSVIPVAAKWLVIGKWKPEVIPVWSLRYFRFWALKSLIRSAPIAMFGAPFYNFYLRLLGAKVGPNTIIQSKQMPVCTDLITIGANTILRKDSLILGYKAQSNYIHIGPIRIGDNAFVGEGGVLDINTMMEDNTQLGRASSLHDGQRIPQGKRYHGCPAQETTTNYCEIGPRRCTPLRRWTYSIAQVVTGFALMPIATVILYAIFPIARDFILGDRFVDADAGQALWLITAKMVPLSFVLLFIGVALGLLYIGTVPRLLNRLLHKDRTYVLYGFHYYVHHMIAGATNSTFYNRLFGDSSAIVHYLRWVGYRLNKIVQTGSNFGMDQKHDNPFLCDIGSGTMVSGGLRMINETMSNSAFKLDIVKIGEHNYLGNDLRVAAQSKIGTNVLVATRTLVPIDGPVRENVGLLGAPCFEIPRAVSRDTQMSEMDDDTRRQRLQSKNRYNLVTAILFLLHTWFLFFAMTVFAMLAFVNYRDYGMTAVFAFGTAAFYFAVFWVWLVERAALRFGRLTPKIVLVLDKYFWFHERHWKLSGLWALESALAGTPFKNILSRLEKVRLGRKVFDDGFHFDENSLIEIGDYTNLNVAGLIQPHSLEEGVFKSDYVKIGVGCTIGSMANIHYGVTMEDYVVLEPNSFVMKGEILDSGTTWRGNPAKAIVTATRAEVRGLATVVAAKVA